MAKKRSPFRIQLTTEAKAELTQLSDQLGITQMAVTTRIVEWFASQPDTVQAAILGLYPESIRREVAAMILPRIEKKPKD